MEAWLGEAETIAVEFAAVPPPARVPSGPANADPPEPLAALLAAGDEEESAAFRDANTPTAIHRATIIVAPPPTVRSQRPWLLRTNVRGCDRRDVDLAVHGCAGLLT